MARRSCRTYRDERLRTADRELLERHMAAGVPGPFGSAPRQVLIAARGGDADELRGLGTYGFIKNAPAFLAGAVGDSPGSLEDYGYVMECAVLAATAAGLGTCWLGGSFTRSGFSVRVGLRPGETLPAVVAVGYPAERPRARDRLLRLAAGSDGRRPWEDMFFDGAFGMPLDREAAGPAAFPLDMVRRAPSASNRQPWRIVRDAGGYGWHLYLARSKGYREKNQRIFGIADMQRIDMGIAMCHFEAAARESGMGGSWERADPGLPLPEGPIEYIMTWKEA